MTNDDDRQNAGHIILRDLETFNKATVFVQQDLQPTIYSVVETVFKDWAKAHEWLYDSEGENDLEKLWIAPSGWLSPDDEYSAWFELNRRESRNKASYQIADLCGVGQTEFGFRFTVEYGQIGGKSAWNKFAKTISDHEQRLREQGWYNEGKGIFFYPLVLSAELMAEAWAQDDWTTALIKPLEHALDALAGDLSIFNAILEKAHLEVALGKMQD